MRRSLTRRRFLTTAVAGLAGWTILSRSASARSYQANEKLSIAQIGCGGRGRWFVDTIPRLGENVVALCDVNRSRAAESFSKLPGVPQFTDYRRMLDEMDKEIDAVIIAAPDHIHAPAGVMAMRMGKHLFCEKPLTNSVHEARVMRRVAAETAVATQMGNQGTATHAFREQVEIIRSGDLGRIVDVIVWNSGGSGGQRPIPTEEQPVPDGLEWDLWLGPRESRPYHRQWMQWHGWREFGTAQLGNWAIHSANVVDMGFRLFELWYADPAEGSPRIRIRAETPDIQRISFPKWEIIEFELPARAEMPPLKFVWLNGLAAPGFRERIETHLGRRLNTGGPGPWTEHGGALIVGTEGTIHSTEHNSSYTLLPKEKFADYRKPVPTLPRSGSHEREWLAACRGGPPAMSNFDYAAVHTELVLLGNVATQFAETIEYDPLAMKITNHAEADRELRRPHRKGWEVE